MKQKELQQAFENFSKATGLKAYQPSHFEGEKYVAAKEGTISLQYADARIGNRVAIVLNTQRGTISKLTSYYTPSELVAFMEGATTNFKKEIRKYIG